MKPRATHTSFKRGKRVFVRLRNGDSFVAKFLGNKGRYVYFFDTNRLLKSDIATMGYNRWR